MMLVQVCVKCKEPRLVKKKKIICFPLKWELRETWETCFDPSAPLCPVRGTASQNFSPFRWFLQKSDERLNEAGDLPKWAAEPIDYRPFPEFISIWPVLISSPKER